MDVQLFDTTLRDGTQSEGLSLSVEDKLKIARLLDGFGIHFIEGGYPGSNPKDVEFFQRAKTSLSLKHAKLTAFGMTRKAGGKADTDPVLRALIEAQTPVVCIVGKSWNLHVTEVLGTTLEENLAMIGDSVALLKKAGQRGHLRRRALLRRLPRRPRLRAGGDQGGGRRGRRLDLLCDTNGGSCRARSPRWSRR